MSMNINQSRTHRIKDTIDATTAHGNAVAPQDCFVQAAGRKTSRATRVRNSETSQTVVYGTGPSSDLRWISASHE